MNNSCKNTKLKASEAIPVLSPDEKHWEKMFQMLVEFKNIDGHCLGPLNHTENIFLWKWIEGQRKNRHTLEPDRKKRLD